MRSAKISKKPPKRNAQRVVVGRSDGGLIPGTPGKVKTARFRNIADAEKFIEKIKESDKEGVNKGEYYLDAPEEMRNPRRSTAKK